MEAEGQKRGRTHSPFANYFLCCKTYFTVQTKLMQSVWGTRYCIHRQWLWARRQVRTLHLFICYELIQSGKFSLRAQPDSQPFSDVIHTLQYTLYYIAVENFTLRWQSHALLLLVSRILGSRPASLWCWSWTCFWVEHRVLCTWSVEKWPLKTKATKAFFDRHPGILTTSQQWVVTHCSICFERTKERKHAHPKY